jgi:hypothetical protein
LASCTASITSRLRPVAEMAMTRSFGFSVEAVIRMM